MIMLGIADARHMPLADASIDAVVCDPPYGLEFMGRAWDRFGTPLAFQQWCEEWAREAFRILKPGGHLIAFGGTRTHHRLACGIEDAGFEGRDELAWLFGSGFPKSAQPLHGMRSLPRHMRREDWLAFYRRARVMTGTALKPAHEPAVFARKPLRGTVAQNVAAFGTGALNIDGARVGTGGQRQWTEPQGMGFSGGHRDPEGRLTESAAGRWPANVVLGCACDGAHDPDCAVALLDASSGERVVNTPSRRGAGGQNGRYRPIGEQPQNVMPLYADSGGASRFFYTAKAPRSEREAGLEDMPIIRRSDGRAKDIENPRLRTSPRRNDHPTVKPVALMRWAVRLITPPGGVVLDPFMGSGSTGLAALDERMHFVGFDLDAHSVEIARYRIDHRHVGTLGTKSPRAATADVPQGKLF